jgi:hypothetical protein
MPFGTYLTPHHTTPIGIDVMCRADLRALIKRVYSWSDRFHELDDAVKQQYHYSKHTVGDGGDMSHFLACATS